MHREEQLAYIISDEKNPTNHPIYVVDIDFGACIFCGNCVEYCPTNCLSMTEEYEMSVYDRHELNYDHIALGRLPACAEVDAMVETSPILGAKPL